MMGCVGHRAGLPRAYPSLSCSRRRLRRRAPSCACAPAGARLACGRAAGPGGARGHKDRGRDATDTEHCEGMNEGAEPRTAVSSPDGQISEMAR